MGPIRGLTAPLFFVITGTVFSYLLHQEFNASDLGYFELNRVKKGFKRVLVLLIIGYLLQLNLSYLGYYLLGNINPHLLGFHILQCIGLSLFCILLFTPALNFLKRYSWLGFIFLAIALFIFTSYIRNDSGFLLVGFNPIIQNVVQGPDTVFSILPWSGFVFFGAGFGQYLSLYGPGKKNRNVYFFLGIAGLFFHIISVGIFLFNNYFTNHSQTLYLWVYERIFQISIVLMLLTYLSQFKVFQSTYLLAIGKETLVVYVLHAILLYGAITGVGLRVIWEHQFSALQSIFGAIIFVAIFVLFAPLIPKIHQTIAALKNYEFSNGKIKSK